MAWWGTTWEVLHWFRLKPVFGSSEVTHEVDRSENRQLSWVGPGSHLEIHVCLNRVLQGRIWTPMSLLDAFI